MPSTSAKQAKFMRAVAHSPKFAKKVGVAQSVGKDFEMADKKKGRKFGTGGSAAIDKAAEELGSKASLSSTSGAPKQKISADLGNASFKDAFRSARSAGDKTFTWKGKSYSTSVASAAKPAAKPSTATSKPAPKAEAKPTAAPAKATPKTESKPAAKATAPSRLAAPAPRSKSFYQAKTPGAAAAEFKTSKPTAKPAAKPEGKRNIDRFNLDKVREMSARMDSKKGTTFGGAFKAKGGKVKKYNKGGMPKESTTGSSTTKPVTPDAVKQRREFEEEMRKRNQQAQNEGKAIGRTGPRHAKGGNVMKKSDKAGRALAKKSADTMGRAMVKKAGGGKCYAKGGSIDGIAKKGKTKGKMC